MKKAYILAIIALSLGIVSFASAHVVVSPSEAMGESYQTFSIGVPSERDAATIGLKLIVPENASSIRPTVKPGWTVSTKKQTIDGKDIITEIDWTGGKIPSGLRDDFTFSAKMPEDGTLIWKAYQTYADGKVVAWENQPAEEHGHDHESVEGPYSVTVITPHDEHASHESGGHIAHDMLLPLLGIGIGMACVIEIGKINKKQQK